MVSMHAVYKGKNKCSIVHDDSQAEFITDAPRDIGGDGSSFSPTDTVGVALAGCILTTIAMWAERNGLEITGAKAHVTKEMSTDSPRRIARLTVTITLPAERVPVDVRERLEKIGHTCPVKKSLHPDVDAPVTYVYE